MKRPILWKSVRGVWYYRLADETVFHSTGLRDRAAAEAEIFANPGKRLYQDKKPRTSTLRQFATGYFLWGNCPWIRKQLALGRPFGRGTAEMRRGHLVRHILPAFGDREFSTITGKQIQDWLVSLELSNQTRNHILYTMRILMREARAARLIQENPLLETEAFGKKDYRRRDVFSAAELRALFPVDRAELTRIWWSHESAVLLMAMAAAGLRSGEARAMQWRQLLWDESALLVDRTVKREGKEPEFGPVDEKKGGARIELLPKRLLLELKHWRRRALFVETADLVFPGDGRGIPITRKTVSRRLSQAIARVNAAATKKDLPEPVHVGERNLVAHSFRHTYVTRLRRQPGVSQEVLEFLTGHHSAAMTNRYDHPQIAERLAAIAPARLAIEALWE